MKAVSRRKTFFFYLFHKNKTSRITTGLMVQVSYIIILSMSLIPGQINIGVLNQVQGARQGTPAGTVDGNGIPLNSVAIARILSETRPLNP